MNHQIHRRAFMQLSALAGAGLTFDLFPTKSVFAADHHAVSFNENDALTPLAIADDCIRLAALASGLAAPLRHSLTAHPPIVYVSGLLRGGQQHVIPLLKQAREGWAARKAGDLTEEKLTLAAGWLVHQAVRETLHPVYKKFADEKTVSECRLYHDVTVLREQQIAETGQRREAAAISSKDAAALFSAMSQRLLMRLHTFQPDVEDVNEWLGRLFAWRARQKALFENFAAACHSPDPAKVRQFVTTVNFYNREDALIRAARSLQRGPLATQEVINAAAQQASSQSLYAQALARGYRKMQAVSEFLKGKADESQLKSNLA
jgi:hypothetical protein